MKREHRPTRKNELWLLLPVVFLVGWGAMQGQKAMKPDPDEPRDQSVPLKLVKVAAKRIGSKEHRFLHLSIFVGPQGRRPMWWDHFGSAWSASMEIDGQYVDRFGVSTPAPCGSNMSFHPKTGLFSLTRDFQVGSGGTLKGMIIATGSGWQHDAREQLLRTSQGDAVRAECRGDFSFSIPVK